MFHHQNIRAGDPCPKACFLCGKEYNGYAENPEEIIFGVKLDRVYGTLGFFEEIALKNEQHDRTSP